MDPTEPPYIEQQLACRKKMYIIIIIIIMRVMTTEKPINVNIAFFDFYLPCL